MYKKKRGWGEKKRLSASPAADFFLVVVVVGRK